MSKEAAPGEATPAAGCAGGKPEESEFPPPEAEAASEVGERLALLFEVSRKASSTSGLESGTAVGAADGAAWDPIGVESGAGICDVVVVVTMELVDVQQQM